MPAKRGCSRSKTRARRSASIRFTTSPDYARGILGYQRIWRRDRHAMHDRLANEEPVERVAMQPRQANGMHRRLFIYGECGNRTRVTLGRDEPFGRLRQSQLSAGVLLANLPCRCGAEKHVVVRILNQR